MSSCQFGDAMSSSNALRKRAASPPVAARWSKVSEIGMRRLYPAGFDHALCPPCFSGVSQSARRKHRGRCKAGGKRERIIRQLQRLVAIAMPVRINGFGCEQSRSSAAHDFLVQ